VKLSKAQRSILERMREGIIVCYGRNCLIWYDHGTWRCEFISGNAALSLEKRGLIGQSKWPFHVNKLTDAGLAALKGGRP